MEGLWHKNAIVYTVDLQSFADGNGDGIGDFLGLSGKLDYLAGLNVNCLWLQPFFPSPRRDHGWPDQIKRCSQHDIRVRRSQSKSYLKLLIPSRLRKAASVQPNP